MTTTATHALSANTTIIPQNSRTLCKLIDDYTENLLVRNYCASTVEAQAKHLRYFQNFCSRLGIHHPNQIQRQQVSAYQNWLFRYQKRDGRPLAAGTQRQWLTDVVSFFRWSVRKEIIPHNPAAELEMPRTEHRLPKAVLSPKEIERVLLVPEVKKPFGLRDRAILEVFYSTGVRRTEMCNLDLTDLDFDNRLLCVRQGKGKKDRYVPIGKRALAWIKAFLQEGRPRLGSQQDPHALFVGAQGRRMVPGRLAGHVGKLIRQAHWANSAVATCFGTHLPHP